MSIKQYTKEEIGAIFSRLRRAARLTQSEVASRLCTTAQTISRWEKGENQPDLNTFFQLCDIYGADIEFEFGLREISNTHGKHLEDPRLDDINIKFYELTPEAQDRVWLTFCDVANNPDNQASSDWIPGEKTVG